MMGFAEGPHTRDPQFGRYEQEYAAFSWNVPEYFNIGVDVCDAWATRDSDRTAIVEYVEGNIVRTSFAQLKRGSDQLSQLLSSLGVRRGDRVAILAPQRVETAMAHIAVYKAGAIAVPLFSLFGEDALLHRLRDSAARLLIGDRDGVSKIVGMQELLPELEHLVAMDEADGRSSLLQEISRFDGRYQPIVTRATDPALIIYTSGTTGASKGALHAHQVLLGHLPGVEMSHNGFPEPGDVMWTPADWAWIGGLLDVLLPSLHHGVPVVAHRFAKFDAEAAFGLIERCRVRNMFLPPTALKMMRIVERPEDRWTLDVRSVASGGEALGPELLEWGRTTLNVTINEFYGQTECNMTVSSCSALFSPRPGAIGKPVPGHTVAILDADGEKTPLGQEGEIAVRSPDPVMFLGYWNRPEDTDQKFRNGWLLTGDRAAVDAQGYIQFVGRADDVITSAGYRIGPAEIEDCLLRHWSVQAAGVVGIPDPGRTEIVSAFIVLKEGAEESAALASELQDLVRNRLGAHQYPRVIRFVAELPLTTTGKLIRKDLRNL